MNPALPRSAAGPYNPWMVAVILSLTPFMEVLDTTIANVSLRHIAGALGASASQSTWVLTSYMVSNSIILPISGWLQQVLGRKRFYEICVALFTVSSVLCAVSTSLEMIIVARVLQGLGGGGLAPCAQTMLADSFPPEKRAPVFALFGFTIICAPAIGPVLGGWITDTLSWHWIFLINLPVGLIAGTLTMIFVHEPALLVRERRDLFARGLRMDYFGLFLVAAGFGSLQFVFDKFEIDDGFSSPQIILLCATATVCLSTLALWEWQHPQPVMNFRLFRSMNFGICALVQFIAGFIMFSSSQLLPQLLQSQLNYSAQTAGLALSAGSLATIVMMPTAGLITGRFIDGRILIVGGLIELGWSMLLQAHMAPDASFGYVSTTRILQMIATPFIYVPATMLAYVGVPARNNGEAAALINQTRNIGGAMGISFVTTILAWRTQFHQERLAEAITPYGDLHGTTLAQIAPIVQQQAGFASYLDAFYVIGLIALSVWPFALLLKAPSKLQVA
jgi:DHA2 family multidrug resistance protein